MDEFHTGLKKVFELAPHSDFPSSISKSAHMPAALQPDISQKLVQTLQCGIARCLQMQPILRGVSALNCNVKEWLGLGLLVMKLFLKVPRDTRLKMF